MTRQAFFDPGALDHRLQLQQPVEQSDGCGGLVISWADAASVWGMLSPQKDRRNFDAQQSEESLLHRIVIRFRSDISSGWRLLLGQRVFTVLTLHDPDERGRYLVLSTREEAQ